MQIMPSPFVEQGSTATSHMSYSQDPATATFSQDLDRAFNGDSSDNGNDNSDGNNIRKNKVQELVDLYGNIDEMFEGSPYGSYEAFSPFVPEPVRFTPAELETLRNALSDDGVSQDALNAITAIAGKVGGPTKDELLAAIDQAMRGGNVALSDIEVTTLQTLSNRVSPENPDKLYSVLRYGKSAEGLEALTQALTKREASLSQEEISAIGKALNLSADSIMGLSKKLQGMTDRPLTTDDVKYLFDDTKAELRGKSDDFERMQASLEKNLGPIMQSAQKREELERQAQMRETKKVAQARTLIEDTVLTKVLGDSLNRKTMTSEQDKSTRADSNAQGKAGNKTENKQVGKSADNQLEVQLQNANQAGAIYTSQKNILMSEANKANDKFTADKVTTEKLRTDKSATDKLVTDKLVTDKSVTDKLGLGRANVENAENRIQEQKTTAEKDLEAHLDRTMPANSTQNSGQDKSQQGLNKEGQKNSLEHAKFEFAFAHASQVQQPQGLMQETAAVGSFAHEQGSPRQSEHVQGQVQSSILSMTKSGVKQLQVSLNPVELGQLSITLSIKSGEISATIHAEKAESASMINMQMDALKAELENQGFKVENISVEVGLNQENNHKDSSYADSRQDWQGANQHNSSRDNFENTQYLERLRNLNKLNTSDANVLAHNMQNSSSMMSQSANSAMTGLHIVA